MDDDRSSPLKITMGPPSAAEMEALKRRYGPAEMLHAPAPRKPVLKRMLSLVVDNVKPEGAD